MKSKTRPFPLRPVILALCAAVILIVGVLLYRRSHLSSLGPAASGHFLSQVDRGLSPANKAAFQKKIDDQKALIAATEKAGPRDVSQYLTLGVMYYGVGDLADSEAANRVILQTLPNDAPALENLGQDQLEAGDYAGAELSWRAALKSEPDEGYYIRLADLIDQHVPSQESTIGPLLDDAVATLGQTQNLLYRLGQWYEKNGQYAQALSHYGVAYQLSGNDVSIKQTMDEVRAKMGRP